MRKAPMAKITATGWELPGLRVAVTSDTKSFSEDKTGDNIDLDLFRDHRHCAGRLRLRQ